MSSIGERLKQLRKERNISQADLAQALGTNIFTVSRWERNVAVPSSKYSKKISKYFGVNELWLLTGEGEKDAPLEEEEQAKEELSWITDEVRSLVILCSKYFDLSPDIVEYILFFLHILSKQQRRIDELKERIKELEKQLEK